ncbi:DUF2653 family protein [Paenibacillus larvae]|uniref:DUF2653 family protein n=1 Tax=Paenibacillus larvae TaxID=1464 RepID=A0AAP5N3J4_9BACL|nr:DUF2653 family protein [Paenibacillus larvae]AQR77892.1 hypothetical protein BXP28_11660 [Paenibacillus larvae subsp. larvae]AVF20981.1 hypothetical protein ERICI_01078 [Paenibacillus larvae subsp. larvae]ETK28047.1 hypothetical protein ERIC1_1c15030 [Paenibacillus larvae subsp. larvae DSM 25719]MCY7475361.1 YxcD family protein [Paenibacillus larvae]MCY7489653.1 YxcD family protein [Paenibacillus larvae]
MRLDEQDIINAVCLNMSTRKQLEPADIEVVLHWDEEFGYSAEVFWGERSQVLIEANLLEAIEQFMFTQMGERVFRNQIKLDLEDEIVAYIET